MDFVGAVWPRNLMDDIEKRQVTLSMLLQAVCIIPKLSVNSSWSYGPATLNLGQKHRFISACVTLQFDGCAQKATGNLFYATASFTDATVRKRPDWGAKFVLNSVTLTSDLWYLLFAWTSLLSMVLNSEIFIIIRWQEHYEKSITDRETDMSVLRAFGRS